MSYSNCSHYWICDHDSASSEILLLSGEDNRHRVSVFDCDGTAINELEVNSENETVVLKASNLLGSCKFKHGIRQAHIRVESQGSNYSRLKAGNKAALMPPMKVVSDSEFICLPLVLSGERPAYLACVNCSSEQGTIRCRLVTPHRVPEHELEVPANGVNLLSLFEEFKTVVPRSGNMYAYLRISAVKDSKIAVCVLESSAKDYGEFFSLVC